MGILSGFKKCKRYTKTSDGYQLLSQWTSSQSVEMDDGNTVEANLGAIKGITDSLTATSSNVALSAAGGKNLQDQLTTINNNLINKQATITGAATTITANNLTTNRALVSDSNGKVAASSITTTQLGYLSGATSNIQTQINSLDNTVVKSNDVGSDFYKVSTLRTFVDTNNAYIQGTKGDYIFGISAFSDKRIKNNIKDSTVNALDVINKIKMREFDFTDEKYGDHNDIGYVAQELMEIVPEAVVSVQQDKEKTGYEELYQVEDKHLIKYLVKAVQELSAEIEKLKNVGN